MDVHTLPMAVEPFFKKLTEEQQMLFLSEYRRRSRSMGVMMALAFLFPIQLFFLGKVGLGVLFLLTVGGAGIWWIVELFLTPGRVRAYNDVVALELARYLKATG